MYIFSNNYLIGIQVSIAGLSTLTCIVSNLLLKEGNNFPQTWYRFHKYFDNIVPKHWKRVVICVNEDHIFQDGEVLCPKCGEQRNHTVHLTYRNKVVPRKWFYYVDFIDLVKHRFAKDPEWVKVCLFGLFSFLILFFAYLIFFFF